MDVDMDWSPGVWMGHVPPNHAMREARPNQSTPKLEGAQFVQALKESRRMSNHAMQEAHQSGPQLGGTQLAQAPVKSRSTSNHNAIPEPDAPVLDAPKFDQVLAGADGHKNAAPGAPTSHPKDIVKAVEESSVYQTRDRAKGATGRERNEARWKMGVKLRGRPRRSQEQNSAEARTKPFTWQRKEDVSAGPSKPDVPRRKKKSKAQAGSRTTGREDSHVDCGDDEFDGFLARIKKGRNAYQPKEGESLTAKLAAAGALDWSPEALHNATRCHCQYSIKGERTLNCICWSHTEGEDFPLNVPWPLARSSQAGGETTTDASHQLLGDSEPTPDSENGSHVGGWDADNTVKDMSQTGVAGHEGTMESMSEVDGEGRSSDGPPSIASTPDFDYEEREA